MSYDNRFKSYDYVQKITDHCTLPNTATYGEINKFYFSDATGIIGINSDGTGNARISDEFLNLTPGDIIEIHAEVRNISGVKVKVGFGEYNSTGGKFFMHEYQTEKSGEWETVNFKYIFRNSYASKKSHFYIGLNTGDIGQFDMRYLRVAIKTKRKYERTIGYKPYELRKGATDFEIRGDFTSGGGTLSVVDTTTLRLTFSVPFRNRPVATNSVDFVGSSGNYTVRIGNLSTTSIDIKFYDSSGTAALLSSVPEGSHFGIVAFGWEIL